MNSCMKKPSDFPTMIKYKYYVLSQYFPEEFNIPKNNQSQYDPYQHSNSSLNSIDICRNQLMQNQEINMSVDASTIKYVQNEPSETSSLFKQLFSDIHDKNKQQNEQIQPGRDQKNNSANFISEILMSKKSQPGQIERAQSPLLKNKSSLERKFDQRKEIFPIAEVSSGKQNNSSQLIRGRSNQNTGSFKQSMLNEYESQIFNDGDDDILFLYRQHEENAVVERSSEKKIELQKNLDYIIQNSNSKDHQKLQISQKNKLGRYATSFLKFFDEKFPEQSYSFDKKLLQNSKINANNHQQGESQSSSNNDLIEQQSESQHKQQKNKGEVRDEKIAYIDRYEKDQQFWEQQNVLMGNQPKSQKCGNEAKEEISVDQNRSNQDGLMMQDDKQNNFSQEKLQQEGKFQDFDQKKDDRSKLSDQHISFNQRDQEKSKQKIDSNEINQEKKEPIIQKQAQLKQNPPKQIDNHAQQKLQKLENILNQVLQKIRVLQQQNCTLKKQIEQNDEKYIDQMMNCQEQIERLKQFNEEKDVKIWNLQNQFRILHQSRKSQQKNQLENKEKTQNKF